MFATMLDTPLGLSYGLFSIMWIMLYHVDHVISFCTVEIGSRCSLKYKNYARPNLNFPSLFPSPKQNAGAD